MTPEDSFQDVWKAAIREYELQTERDLQKDDTFRKFASVRDLEEYVRRREENFLSFREEHHRLFSRLSKCIQPLVPLLDIVKGGVEASPYAPAAIAFGAASYLLQACEKVTKCYDAVEELFGQVEDITVRLQQYEQGAMEPSLKAKMASILAFVLEIMGKTEKVVRRRRVKQWFKSVFLDDDEVGPSLEKLRKFVENELGLVVALTYAKVGDLQSTTSEILSNQRSERLRIFTEADEKLIAEALGTRTADRIAAMYAQNVDNLTKGTGAWIRDDPTFQAWKEGKTPILWVFGRPGVGKTMLATRTIESLKADFPQHPDIPSFTSVSSLYFKDDNPDLKDCTRMWKAAARQIVATDERFKKHVLSVLKQPDAFVTSRRTWELLFLDFFMNDSSTRGQLSSAMIVVDGLDEAPEDERINFLSCLSALTKIASNRTRCRIQIAVFARPDVRADSGFDSIGSQHAGRIFVTPDRNSKDIGAFVKQQLSTVLVLKLLRKRKETKAYERLAKHIYSAVQSRSQGMFLWASLVFGQIRNLPSWEAVRASLAQAPEGLDDMLHHVFKRFEADGLIRQTYLKDLLTLVLCTNRQLQIAELFILLRLITGQHFISLEQDLHGRYASIFNVTWSSGESIGDADIVGEENEQQEEGASEPGDDDFDFVEDPNDGERADEEVDGFPKGDVAADTHAIPTMESASAPVVGTPIPESWRTKLVTFAHARVRDFLVTEYVPRTRRWHDNSLFAQDLNESKQRIVAAYIGVLRDNTFMVDKAVNLTIYACRNWMRHLVEIDHGEPGSVLSVKLARDLAGFFNDGWEFSRSSWNSIGYFLNVWFETNEYLKIVRRLIVDNVDHLDEGHRAWGQRVKVSCRALFEAPVREWATIWLTKSGFDDPDYLERSEAAPMLLCAFDTLGDHGVDENRASLVRYVSQLSLDAIEAAAHLVPLPQNEHWHVGVGHMLVKKRSAPHAQKAMEHFNRAKEMADDAWVAREGLAICHGILGQYREAIAMMNEAIELLPRTPSYSGVDIHLRSAMGDWHQRLGNLDDAVQATRRAYEGTLDHDYPSRSALDHYTRISVRNHIQVLYDMEKYAEIVEFIRHVDARATQEKGRSLWIVFIRCQWMEIYDVDVFTKFRTLVQTLGVGPTVPIIRDSVERAFPLKQDVFFEFENLGFIQQSISWLHERSEEQEYVVELCRRVIQLIDASDEASQQVSQYARNTAATVLGGYYLKTAIDRRAQGEDPASTIAQLEGLTYYQQGGRRYIRAALPAVYMGQWLHDHADAEDSEWMPYVRPSIEASLRLLSDDNPWNDQFAYAQLGVSLLHGNDILNARTALGITMKPLEQAHEDAARVSPGTSENVKDQPSNTSDSTQGVATESSYSDETKIREVQSKFGEKEEPGNFKYTGFEQMWTCDGCPSLPGNPSRLYKELHFCRICVDTAFCDICIVLLRRGDLSDYTTCRGTHDLVQIFPLSDEARTITDALLEKRFDVQEEWLDALWKTWVDRDAHPKAAENAHLDTNITRYGES